eukprot:5929272-Pleurochrysis_carterae.AAC.2
MHAPRDLAPAAHSPLSSVTAGAEWDGGCARARGRRFAGRRAEQGGANPQLRRAGRVARADLDSWMTFFVVQLLATPSR